MPQLFSENFSGEQNINPFNHNFEGKMANFESFHFPSEEYEGIHDTSKTLFIGDLSYFCTEEDLLNIFSGYGPVLTVRVRRGVTGDSLMHGFVALASTEAAQQAIRDLDGIEFMGRNMRVQLSADGQKPAIELKDNYIQVHVSFISKQTNFLITEKVLRDIFSQYGNVADVAIKKHSTLQKQHRQSGYGFVYFLESDSAYRAMLALKHNTVKDITLDCSISHKSEQLIQPVPRSNNPRYQTRAMPPNVAPETFQSYQPRNVNPVVGSRPTYDPNRGNNIFRGPPQRSPHGLSTYNDYRPANNPYSLVTPPGAQFTRQSGQPRRLVGSQHESAAYSGSELASTSYGPVTGYQNPSPRWIDNSEQHQTAPRGVFNAPLEHGIDATSTYPRFPGLVAGSGYRSEVYHRDQRGTFSTGSASFQTPVYSNQSSYVDSRRKSTSDNNSATLVSSFSDLTLGNTSQEFSNHSTPRLATYSGDGSYLVGPGEDVYKGSRSNSLTTITTMDSQQILGSINYAVNGHEHASFSSNNSKGNIDLNRDGSYGGHDPQNAFIEETGNPEKRSGMGEETGK